MSRLNLVDLGNATPQQRAALQPVQERLGGNVPRPVRVLAHSPATLAAFFGLHHALGQGLLTARVREQIALAIGNAQGCRYCVSHHTQLGRRMGLTDEELDLARSGRAPEARVEAALQFARQLAARHQVEFDVPAVDLVPSVVLEGLHP
jgi:AhpD family alkylhydroperoxidase